jgi:hypothetical protein
MRRLIVLVVTSRIVLRVAPAPGAVRYAYIVWKRFVGRSKSSPVFSARSCGFSCTAVQATGGAVVNSCATALVSSDITAEADQQPAIKYAIRFLRKPWFIAPQLRPLSPDVTQINSARQMPPLLASVRRNYFNSNRLVGLTLALPE